MITISKIITKLKPITFGLSAAIAFNLIGCSTPSKEAYYNNLEAEQIFNEGLTHLQKHHYHDAIIDFEALEARYPFGSYGDKAQLGEIYGFYKTREYASVMAAADRFIRVYPVHPHLDYVLYMRGLASVADLHGSMSRLPMERNERDLTNAELAIQDFSRLIQRYPNSTYIPSASRYMIYLRNLLAEHEMVASEYYYRRGAYLAAANRAKDVLEHYDQTPAVQSALVILIKSYRQLELNDLANHYLNLLNEHFPNEPAIKKLNRG